LAFVFPYGSLNKEPRFPYAALTVCLRSGDEVQIAVFQDVVFVIVAVINCGEQTGIHSIILFANNIVSSSIDRTKESNYVTVLQNPTWRSGALRTA
jgi:hypothetical protein